QAIQAYKSKEFTQALDAFKEVVDINPFDMASLQYIQRCQKFIDLGFPDDWDGIESYN
ncbi:MAG: hypothetical protein IMY74_10500, partial [Bacteroidetes bacterium]|nr:hypothetical protein [Bacteroidota bacterium]